MLKLKFAAAGIIAAYALAGCQTAPVNDNPAGMIRVIEGPDGQLIAVDGNGNEVSSPEAEMLLALTSGLQNGAELSDEEIWSTDTEGNITHIQSGGICPKTWGEFDRSQTTIYRRDGSDVGCNYMSVSLNSSFTFYVYQSSVSLAEELDIASGHIQNRKPTAKQVDVYRIPPSPTYVANGFESTNSSGVKVRDSVLLEDDQGWRVKLRMTYPSEFAQERESLAGIMLQGQVDQVGRNSITTIKQIDPSLPELDT